MLATQARYQDFRAKARSASRSLPRLSSSQGERHASRGASRGSSGISASYFPTAAVAAGRDPWEAYAEDVAQATGAGKPMRRVKSVPAVAKQGITVPDYIASRSGQRRTPKEQSVGLLQRSPPPSSHGGRAADAGRRLSTPPLPAAVGASAGARSTSEPAPRAANVLRSNPSSRKEPTASLPYVQAPSPAYATKVDSGLRRSDVDSEPKRDIDALTSVPQDLYDDLLKFGRQVREGGQHVLVDRPGRRGPRLVQWEQRPAKGCT